jgi:hypothetical protein
MIEEIVLNYLSKNLDVFVGLEEPSKVQEYVIIEKTGSSCSDFVMSATIALKSHADTLHKAAKLNEAVKSAMNNIVSLGEVSSSKLHTDYNFTDTTKKKYRYQAVYDLVY